MSTTEVLTVEITLYTSGDKTAYVPRLYGQTAETHQSKQATTRPNHDEDDFLDDVATKEANTELEPDEATTLRDLYAFGRTEADDYDFAGTANVSVTARWSALGESDGMFTLNAAEKVVLWQPANIHDPGESDWSHDALTAWYEAVGQISHPTADVERFTDDKKRLPIAALVDEEDRKRLKTACLDSAAACSD